MTAQALCNKISPMNLARVQGKLLQLASLDAALVAEVVLSNAQTNSYYLELLVKVLGAMPALAVAAHVERLSNAFVDAREHMLVDELDTSDYDAFCAFLAAKRVVRARHFCILTLGDADRLHHTVDEMLHALGQVQSRYCKDLMIDLLQDYCGRRASAARHVVEECTIFLQNPTEAGLDSKTRFKLMDMVASLSGKMR